MTTYFSSPEAEAAAHAVAARTPRNITARRLLDGSEDWSLASLRGKAKSFGGSYARSRDAFYRRLRDAGLQPVTLYLRHDHNRRVVII